MCGPKENGSPIPKITREQREHPRLFCTLLSHLPLTLLAQNPLLLALQCRVKTAQTQNRADSWGHSHLSLSQQA